MLEGHALRREVEHLSDFVPTASETQHFLLATLVEEFSSLVLQQLGRREIEHLQRLHLAIGACLGAYEAAFTPNGEQTHQTGAPAIQAPTHTHGLVVEDEGLIAFDLKSLLVRYGMTVSVAPSLARAWNNVTKQLPDVAVLDIRVLDGETYDLARYLLEKGTSVIFVTAYPSLPEDLAETPCLTKPLNADELGSFLEKSLVDRSRAFET